ncbi:uncharacterized protein LOC141856870 isoform X2 [Brevipalpus obovatus]|uniref:uncharacterized protein LOC141856870 isoform X2 n=1 Tax=Brevipalpus obovatus TaxID=246614 RepID=UPI003D9DED1A
MNPNVRNSSSSSQFSSPSQSQSQASQQLTPLHTPTSSAQQHHHQSLTQHHHGIGIDPLNKLYCSLLSGLKNEMDFGVRVATILANSKESEWISDFKFLDILIESCQLYTCCCDEDDDQDEQHLYKELGVFKIREDSNKSNGQTVPIVEDIFDDQCLVPKKKKCTFDNIMPEKKCDCSQKFWSGLNVDESILQLAFSKEEYKKPSNTSSNGEPCVQSNPESISEDSCDITCTDDENMEVDGDGDIDCSTFFNLRKHPPTNHQRIYRTMKSVCEIIRNLSFNIEQLEINKSLNDPDDNSVVKYSAGGSAYSFATSNLMKFLILLISCKDQYFNNIGLDTLSNIASLIDVNSNNKQYLKSLELINRHCIDSILFSNDINRINRCLEITSKLVVKYSDKSSDYLVSHLEQELIHRLTELLTCQHDVILVITCLECFRALSECCPEFLIKECPNLLKILLVLVNCDASEYFTKTALARVKVIDERRKLPPEGSNKNIILASKSNAPLDQESFTISWLKTTYEAKPSASRSALKISDMYDEFTKHCLRNGRKNTSGMIRFTLLITKCFPSSTIIQASFVEGLIHKPQFLTTTTTPMKILTGIPGGTVASTTSTLIKNLLANKLRNGGSGSHGISTSNSSNVSITFSTLTAGSVTVTPATTISSGAYNSSTTSSSNTTTTIIPCSINNLSLNSLKFNQHRPSSPGPISPTYDKPSKISIIDKASAMGSPNKTQTTIEVNPVKTSSLPASVITSVSSSVSSGLTTLPNLLSRPTTIIVTTTLPTSTINSHTTSSNAPTMTVTPAITSTPLLVTSSAPTNTQTVIAGINQVTVSSSSHPITSSSAITMVTPHLSTITHTQATTNAPTLSCQSLQRNQVLIGTSQPGAPGQPGQPQQFLLVRTIIGNQQTGLVPNPGTPVRLLLPPNFLTQQRPMQSGATVNGVATSSSGPDAQLPQIRLNQATLNSLQSGQVITVVSTPPTSVTSTTTISSVPSSNTVASISTLPPVTSSSSSSNDILLKAVLGSGIVSESSPSSNSNSIVTSQASSLSNTVKSSPLLNVLLDKGKLPDFSTMAGTNSIPVSSSVSVSSNTSVTLSSTSATATSQATKMYILTTKTPLAVKNLPNIQNQIQSSISTSSSSSTVSSLTSSLLSSGKPQPIIVASSSQSQPVQSHSRGFSVIASSSKTTHSENIKVNSSTSTTVTLCSNPVSSSSSSESSHSSHSISVSTQKASSSVTSDVKMEVFDCKSNNLNNGNDLKPSTLVEGLSNGEVTIDAVTVFPSKTVVNSDLSSIREICKTVDDATKLISKRSNEEISNSMNVIKKAKTNSNSNSICVTTVKGGPVKNVNHSDATIISCDKFNTSLPSSPSPSPSPSSLSSSSSNTTSVSAPNTVILTKQFNSGAPTGSCSSSSDSSSSTPSNLPPTTSSSVTTAVNNSTNTRECNSINSTSVLTVSTPSLTTSVKIITAPESVATSSAQNQPISNEVSEAVAKSDSTSASTGMKSNGAPIQTEKLRFMCEWHGCKQLFARPAQVYWHVHKSHVNIYEDNNGSMSCHWGGSEGIGPGCKSSRPKLSLLTHLHDFHCNPNALLQAAKRREQVFPLNTAITPATVPPAHPGYADNAAFLAIKRHAVNYVEPIKPPLVTPITPISVSIRITAALILRNLAEASQKIRTLLQPYEPYLTELCVSEGREESRTIAQCLSLLVDQDER